MASVSRLVLHQSLWLDEESDATRRELFLTQNRPFGEQHDSKKPDSAPNAHVSPRLPVLGT